MHDEHDLKYNIQLNGGATPHTFTTTHTWRRTLARETLMGATSWLKGCSWQPRSRDTDGRHHGSKAFMVVRPHAPRHDDAACDELLTAHTTHTTYIVTHPGSIGAGGSVCTHTRTCIHTKTAHTRTHAHAPKNALGPRYTHDDVQFLTVIKGVNGAGANLPEVRKFARGIRKGL